MSSRKLAIATLAVFLTLRVVLGTAEAVHEFVVPRPAHLPQSTAHTPAVPTSGGDIAAWAAMQNGYGYWNGQAATRTLQTYNTPVTFAGAKHDLIVDFVLEQPFGQPVAQACVYDFSHCLPVPADDPGTSGSEAGYAWYTRYSDLNVGHVVWDATQYSIVGDNYTVESTNFKIVAARHELGHDNHLHDHASSYDGLMCHSNSCTRRASANTTELDFAQAYLVAKPIPPHTISVTATTSTTITVSFSGQGNADNLTPWYKNGFLTAWNSQSNIATGSGSYTFTGLSPSTSYNLRIASNKSGQPAGSSHWVTASTTAPPALGRVANLTMEPNTSSQITLTWSSLSGATSYEVCHSTNPNTAPGSWTCANVGNVTSSNRSINSTSTKGAWYYAVRGVGSGGVLGTFSNRAGLTRFNENISGTTYNSYHTMYKNSSGTKRVNGWNRNSSTRWLVFNNGNGAQNKWAAVSGNSKMYSSASSWTHPDNNGAFGPYVLTVESPSSSFLPQDNIAMSTVCMVIAGGCN